MGCSVLQWKKGNLPEYLQMGAFPSGDQVFHSVSLCLDHASTLVTSCHTGVGNVIGANPASKLRYMLMVPLHDETAVHSRGNHHLTEYPGTLGTMLLWSMPTPFP